MIKKLGSIILAIILVMSCFVAVACGGGEEETSNVISYTNPNRVLSVTDTEDYVVANGKSDYVVVIPEMPSDYIIEAKNEFVELFRKATDITLPVIRDTGLAHSASAKYVSIGETKLYQSSGISIDREKLTTEGGKITTLDKTIYILGGSDKGTLYSVYTFMSLTFNFENYWKDCYEIDRGVTDLKLKNYQVMDPPDFEYRATNYGMYNDSSEDYDLNQYSSRMRMSGDRGENFMPIFQEIGNKSSKSSRSTNAECYLPNDETKYVDNEWGTFKTYWDNYSDKWFSINGKQFCYTARGDADAFNAMIEICAAKICFSLTVYDPITNPQYTVVTLTQQDNSAVCTCTHCAAAKEKYAGANSGALCVFNNKVMEKVDEWMNKPENAQYKRDITLIFFAYDFSTAPPAKQDDSGKWVAASEEVLLRDDVGIFFANQYFENQLSIYDPINDNTRKYYDGWNAITDNVFHWVYGANFAYFMYLYDTFSFYNSEGYQFFASKGGKLFINQAKDQAPVTTTAWSNLGAYLDSKLQWNSSLDTDTLIDNYFNAMFKDGADTMKELFLEMRAYNSYVLKTNNLYKIRSIYNKVANASYWPIATLESWLAKIDKAVSEIEHLKETNYSAYISTLNHIETEAISPIYILVSLHGTSLSGNKKTEYLDRLQTIMERIGAQRMYISDQGGHLETWLESMR